MLMGNFLIDGLSWNPLNPLINLIINSEATSQHALSDVMQQKVHSTTYERFLPKN